MLWTVRVKGRSFDKQVMCHVVRVENNQLLAKRLHIGHIAFDTEVDQDLLCNTAWKVVGVELTILS